MTSIAAQAEPILTAVCTEPQGEVIRSVYPLQLTADNLKMFWEKSRHFRYIFDKDVAGDFAKFCDLFLYEGPDGLTCNGLFWIVDDWVGIFYINHIRPAHDAQVHYTFFDRRHRGRVELAKEMLKYGFRKYNFRRLSVEIPLYATGHAFEFIQACGFRKEGRRRKAVWHNDDWFDVAEFGILKEEALNGS